MSRVATRAVRYGSGYLICLAAVSCGGGGSNALSGGAAPVAPAANVVAVAVTAGPTNDSINTLYTTVTVCLPGTSTCQTIDNIQVDTGSYGLRLLAEAVTLSLTPTTLASGNALVECTVFVDGYSWGPLARVDLQISGESASAVPVQLIGDKRYPTVPTDCQNSGPMPEDTIAQFHAKGILGIGPFAQDCGTFCVNNIPVPAQYYACTASACQSTTVLLTSQVPNPVTLFTADNNGTMIVLPSVAIGGAANVTGSLIFGIDTQSNNQSGSQSVVPIATSGASAGYLTIVFKGQTLSQSFIDSGSNGIFFNDLSIPKCTNANFVDFYCPTGTPPGFQAMLQGANGASFAQAFNVGDAQMLSAAFTAFPDLAGTYPNPQGFDWGMPFFYGRRVATAIEGYSTSAGTGPYIAF